MDSPRGDSAASRRDTPHGPLPTMSNCSAATSSSIDAPKSVRYPRRVRLAASVLTLCGVTACQPLDFTYAAAREQESQTSIGQRPLDDATSSSTSASTEVDVVVPGGLDFGDVGCGSSPPPKAIEIRNTHKSSIELDAVVADTNIISIAPKHAYVAAGSSVVLMVSTAVSSDAHPSVESTTVTITTNGPSDAPHVFSVRRSIVGAIFTSSRSGVINFHAVATSKSESFEVRNEGNLPGEIALDLSSADTFGAGPATFTIPAGDSARVRVSASPPNGGSAARAATLRFSSDSVVCGRVPASIELRCRRND